MKDKNFEFEFKVIEIDCAFYEKKTQIFISLLNVIG